MRWLLYRTGDTYDSSRADTFLGGRPQTDSMILPTKESVRQVPFTVGFPG